MKANISLFILILSISLFGCHTSEKDIELYEGLSIVLPGEFILDENHSTSINILEAHYRSQQIICAYAPISGLDTITSEMATSMLRLNTEALEFSFKYARMETRYQVYGKSLIYNDHMSFLMYEAPYPVETKIEDRIGRFF